MTPAPSRRLQVSALLCLLAGCEPQTMPVISPPGPLPGGTATVPTSRTVQAESAEPATLSPELTAESPLSQDKSATPDTQPAASQSEIAAKEPSPPKGEVKAPAGEKDGPPIRKPLTNRAPRKPGEPIPASFDILILGMKADMVFRDFMLSDEVRELDGQKIELTGYMNPFTENRAKETKFILLRNTECKFGPGGQADHLAEILLSEGVRTAYSVKPVTVVGILRITPKQGEDGNTWSIYTIENAALK